MPFLDARFGRQSAVLRQGVPLGAFHAIVDLYQLLMLLLSVLVE